MFHFSLFSTRDNNSFQKRFSDQSGERDAEALAERSNGNELKMTELQEGRIKADYGTDVGRSYVRYGDSFAKPFCTKLSADQVELASEVLVQTVFYSARKRAKTKFVCSYDATWKCSVFLHWRV